MNKLIIETKNINDNIPFVLFSDCFIYKGARRSIIYDSRRFEYFYIPNSLFKILKKHSGNTINEIKKIKNFQYDDMIDEYFNFLLDKELIFFCSQPSLFPPIKTNWDIPSIINNAIIDFNRDSNHSISSILLDLEKLNCKNIEMRFYDKIDVTKLEKILLTFKDSSIKGIDIIIPFNKKNTHDNYISLHRICPRITSISIHSTPLKI